VTAPAHPPAPADPALPDLIPADVRARLKNLQITSRHAAGTRGFGLHRSPSRGAGMEFSQYRAYEPGDELRQVDWKLYARSDRFFVREAERDSPLDVWLLLDTSASMSQRDAARPGWSRLHAAIAIAACTIEIALRQGDRFGLAAIGHDHLQLTPIGAGPRHRDRCLIELHKLTAAGAWPATSAAAAGSSRARAAPSAAPSGPRTWWRASPGSLRISIASAARSR